jgi:hypothetical protein
MGGFNLSFGDLIWTSFFVAYVISFSVAIFRYDKFPTVYSFFWGDQRISVGLVSQLILTNSFSVTKEEFKLPEHATPLVDRFAGRLPLQHPFVHKLLQLHRLPRRVRKGRREREKLIYRQGHRFT